MTETGSEPSRSLDRNNARRPRQHSALDASPFLARTPTEVADQPAREADQDRREGRQPRPIRHLPAGGGRGFAADVRRHPVADRQAPGTTRARMRGAWSDVRQATTAEVRLHAANQRVLASRRNQLAGSAASYAHRARLLLSKTLKREILAPQAPGIGGISV